ncbi:hypothetical protein SAMN05216226_108138 [Halovenus aranensis]|uniref:Uncharacterized protein n=1 Tax=Halovenus aranensis TaxID=890420 RepID=A0A1G8W8K4_9EURY|nr:hypothetical protein [Halovenus aranensis]SDJ74629.1 hypothetical protein SAMN05216226_108138 [Halovenus aranensis]
MSWAELFERATTCDATTQAIQDRRGNLQATELASDNSASDADEAGFRVVADADVLAADLLVGGATRDALDHVRRHSWVHLVASDHLLGQARALIAEFAPSELAADWETTIVDQRLRVEHPSEDHPALASAYRSGATQLLTLDGSLTATGANLSLQSHMSVSIRTPDAFATVFDPAPVYEREFGNSYPGPDSDPRQ